KALEEARQGKVVPASMKAEPKAATANEDATIAAENQKLKEQIAALEKQVQDKGVTGAEASKAATELANLKNRFIEAEKQRETLRLENQKLADDLKKAQDQKGSQQNDIQAQL